MRTRQGVHPMARCTSHEKWDTNAISEQIVGSDMHAGHCVSALDQGDSGYGMADYLKYSRAEGNPPAAPGSCMLKSLMQSRMAIVKSSSLSTVMQYPPLST